MVIESLTHAPAAGSWWGVTEHRLRADDPEAVILVVDDDPICCRMVADVLDAAGYAVEWTSEPAFAFERALKQPYALVIADVNMPSVSGPELLASMRRYRPSLGALLISGTRDAAAQRDARVLGVEILPKPFEAQRLISVVRRLLAQRVPG
jgi:DNA-binding NtrC family response regulator